jgi:hypothetical protein
MRPAASDDAVDFIVNGADVIERFDLMGSSCNSSGRGGIVSACDATLRPAAGRAVGQQRAGSFTPRSGLQTRRGV